MAAPKWGNTMDIKDRKNYFVEALERELGKDTRLPECWGSSNIARFVPGGLMLGSPNLAKLTPDCQSIGFVSRLMPLPNAEVYICGAIISEMKVLHERLEYMITIATSGNNDFSKDNNNVSIYLGHEGKIYLVNKKSKTDELQYPVPEFFGNPILLNTLYYSIYCPNTDNNQRTLLIGLLGELSHFLGSDKLKEIPLWGKFELLPSTLARCEVKEVEGMIREFHTDLEIGRLIFGVEQISCFVSALLAKPFVILTGLSGSGKTKLAQSFARWISENIINDSSDQYVLAAVGADWDNNENLLGYPDALRRETMGYCKPSNGVLDLIIRASKEGNSEKPFFIILDEMNLSHVERYFADVLSALESWESIYLHEGNELWGDERNVPGKLKLPENLFIIGTVNIDETTYMFSPKVLDRANVIEVRVDRKDMEYFLNSSGTIDLNSLVGKGSCFAKSFVNAAQNKHVGIGNLVYKRETGVMRILGKSEEKGDDEQCVIEKLKVDLLIVFDALEDAGAEFGYRTVSEIHKFFYFYTLLMGDKAKYLQALDAQVMQKLLPKLHGSIRKLSPVLDALLKICGEEGDLNLKYSARKLNHMKHNLERNGFTSFTEA